MSDCTVEESGLHQERGRKPRKGAETSPRMPSRDELVRVIEALLFVGNEPLAPDRVLAAFPSITAAEFLQAIRKLTYRYETQNRPYQIRRAGGGYVLELRPRFRENLRARARVDRGVKLPRPVVEVLSLVAYRQPITKEEMEALSGSDPSGAIRQLLRRGLIERQSKEKGVSPTFVTTQRFLELFQIESLEELPSSEELS